MCFYVCQRVNSVVVVYKNVLSCVSGSAPKNEYLVPSPHPNFPEKTELPWQRS